MISICLPCGKKNYTNCNEFLENYKDDLNSLGFEKLQCPCCGAIGRFRSAGEYNKDVVVLISNERKDLRIPIYRVFCKSCKKTHALLPDFTIPFGSYTTQFVIYALSKYITRNSRVDMICEEIGVSISTLYSWIHTFVVQFNLTKSILNKIHWVSLHALEEVASKSFMHHFRTIFGFCFLQVAKATHYGGKFIPP